MASKQSKSDSNQVPKNQFDLPVGFTPEGSMVTLRQLTEPSTENSTQARPLAQLSPRQMAELTVKRIEMQPKFEMGAISAGRIDKNRAIAEVKAQTPIGKSLIEIETQVIQDILNLAGK